MSRQNALLIIDAQYDFCNPSGALFVEGANGDMNRLAKWMIRNKSKIDHISVTIDNHQVNDIAHPSFWEDSRGNYPAPFTPITCNDIKKGKWMPRFFQEEAVSYVEMLEKQGEFGHFIWPYHCLTGSRGAALEDDIMKAIFEWAGEGKYYHVVTKGNYPVTEHFGIFRANIPVAGIPETQLNHEFIDNLNEFQNIYVAGEAKSHCVANSLKQAMEEAPDLAQKFILLEDCMSDVKGLGYLAEPIYKKARELGIKFARSGDVIL